MGMKKLAVIYFGVMVVCTALVTGFPFSFFGKGAPDAVAKQPTDATPEGAGATVALDQSMTNLTAQIMAELSQPAAPKVDPAVVEANIAAMTVEEATVEDKAAAVLSHMNGTAAQPGVDDPLYNMTASALLALQGDQAQMPAPPVPDPTIELAVAQALQEGKSDEAIDTMVNEAALAGTFAVPASMVTSEGRVDTAVLLASVLQVAQGPGEEFGQGDASPGNAERDALSVKLDGEDVLYTVGSGDSLGSLALRFYGDAGRAAAIFEANRSLLATPNSLRVGQELTLPRRDSL
jgi:nucleoid-associated protein YgaU